MLKIIFTTLCLFFIFSLSSNAQQWKFGIRSGASYCKNIQKKKGGSVANFHYLYYTKPRMGADISFAAQKLITDKIGMDLSIGYSLKGGNFNATLGVGTDRAIGTSHYTQFSPAFLYHPFKNVNATAGVNVGYLLHSDMVGNELQKKWDISWSIGSEYLFKNIGLFIKYQRSITPFFVEDNGVEFGVPKYSFFNSSIQVGATYYFSK